MHYVWDLTTGFKVLERRFIIAGTRQGPVRSFLQCECISGLLPACGSPADLHLTRPAKNHEQKVIEFIGPK